MTAMTFDTPLRPSSARPAASSAARVADPAGTPAARRSASPVRLTRRGRALLLLTLAMLILVAFSLGRTSADAGASAPRAPRTTVVQPGETLWSIASRVAPEQDPRRVIQVLTDLNALGSGPLQAGQRLLLPPA